MPIPGFVDIQINGWGGIDFSSETLTEEEVESAFDAIIATGTVGFLPTVITSTLSTYRHVLPILARAVKKRPRTTLGLHLEGPFLDPTPGARGSHKADRIREPDTAFLAELLALADGTVKILTVAAGRPGCSKLIKAAVAAGIHVALGHHMATLEQLEEAVEAGATMLTHLGNGAPNQVHRHNNPLIAGLGEPRLAATIVTDGFHLPKAAIAAIIYAKKHNAGVVVVSDAAYLAGLGAGRYHRWNGLELEMVEERPGAFVIRNPSEQCLAGAAASMLQCANHLWGLKILDTRAELEDMVFHAPLRLIGLTAADVDGDAPRVRWAGDDTGFALID